MDDFGTKHILELPLNNDIKNADSFVFDQAATGNTFRIQFLGVIQKMLQEYVAGKDLGNLTEDVIDAFIARIAQPHDPDDGTGVVLRTHSNETQDGLAGLSRQLVGADIHMITDKFFESLTVEEFKHLCELLAGTVARESSNTKDGTLANTDLTNLTEKGNVNLNRVRVETLVQTGSEIVIPATMLNRCVTIDLNQNVGKITLPTAGLDTTMLQQIIIIVNRNGFDIAADAFTSNGYTLRGTGATMPSFSSHFVKDTAIEFFCEFDAYSNKANPQWNYGYSKIGH